MQDNNIREKCRELATRLYELDGEVYKSVGSSLGRTFTGDREGTIRNLSALMYTKPDGHLLRSEMALISNMARTIKDSEEKSRLMKEYDEILKAIEQLPNMFGSTDIVDAERVALNLAARREKISENLKSKLHDEEWLIWQEQYEAKENLKYERTSSCA